MPSREARNFTMDPKDEYNLALDCVDKHGNSLLNKHKTALVYLKEDPSTGRLREPPLRLSYSSLQGLTNAMANAFARLELERGSRAIIRLKNCVEFPLSFLGAIKAGLIPVPSSPQLTVSELDFLLRDSQAKVLVTSEECLPESLLDRPPPDLRHVILICDPARLEIKRDSQIRLWRWQDLLKDSEAHFETKKTKAEDPAYWLYTSGTTGKPKAVIHAHRSISAHDERAKLWLDVQGGDVAFNTSGLHWSYALTCGLLDLWRHGLTSVVYQGELSAEKICQILRRQDATTFMSVPGLFRRLLQYFREDSARIDALRKVRVCLSAGESLSPELKREFKALTGLEIHEGLGMTEHSVYLVQPHGESLVPCSCGKPLPGQKISILREDLSEASPDEVGILASHRSCPGLMLGYYQRPEEESLSFKGDWFLSGDLAKRDAEGNYFFLGRADDTLTAGGYRVSPLEVEAALNQHEWVAESAVVGKEIEPGKTIIQAFVVTQAGIPLNQESSEKILQHARLLLAPYKLPRQIIFLRELPKTSNGKLRRSQLLKL